MDMLLREINIAARPDKLAWGLTYGDWPAYYIILTS